MSVGSVVPPFSDGGFRRVKRGRGDGVGPGVWLVEDGRRRWNGVRDECVTGGLDSRPPQRTSWLVSSGERTNLEGTEGSRSVETYGVRLRESPETGVESHERGRDFGVDM